MKINILGKLLFILFLGMREEIVWAQKEFYVGLRVIPQASYLINRADPDSGLIRNFTPGYAIGMAVGQNFTRRIGFEFSILYSLQGQKYTRDGTSGNKSIAIDEKIELTYLKIPMLIRYYLPISFIEKGMYFTTHLGSQVAVLWHMQQYEKNALLPENVAYSRYIKRRDLFNPTEIHLVGGIGWEYTPSPQFLVTALFRADYSLIDALDKTLKTPGQPNSYNMTLGMMLGFSYLINR